MKILETFKIYYKILLWSNKLKEVLMNNTQEKKSELFLTLGTIIVNIFLTIQGLLPAELLAKILTLLTGIYTIARTIIKMTKTKKDDEILAKIEEILKKNNIEINDK